MEVPSGLRFSPPDLQQPPALQWLLAAAFAPALAPLSEDTDTTTVVDLARSFDLAPRVVARHGADRLRAELGPGIVELIRLHRRAVARDLAAEQAARGLAARAAALGLPVILLKGQAMKLAAPGPFGWRPALDLDVLTRVEDAERLRDALLDSGWRSQVGSDNPHHLAPLIAPEGTPVDIHFRLRGVSLHRQGWATGDELLAGDLCRSAPGSDGSLLVPAIPVLAAHLVAHAIEQHGHRPGTYPLLRAVADLADLQAIGRHDLERELPPLVGDTVSRQEVEALSRLARLLTGGHLPDPSRREDEAADRLLKHIVAGTLDARYRDALQLDHSAARSRHARREGRLLRYLFAKLYLTDAEIEARHGRPSTRWGYLRRRLARPVVLFGRFVRAAVARLRHSQSR